MHQISIAKPAMSVGTAFAAWHVIWATVVALGWATSVLNFIFELHFLKIDFQLAPYSTFTALSLVAINFCAGALLGAIFAIVWNRLSVSDERADDTERSPATAS
jgi:hypothetical protein